MSMSEPFQPVSGSAADDASDTIPDGDVVPEAPVDDGDALADLADPPFRTPAGSALSTGELDAETAEE